MLEPCLSGLWFHKKARLLLSREAEVSLCGQIYDRIQSLEAEVRELRALKVPSAGQAAAQQRSRGSTESEAALKDGS